VPLDGSPAAEHALPYALALARRSGAEVMLAHVYSALQAAGDPELLGWSGGEYLVEPLRDYLEGLAARVRGACPIRVRTVLLRGNWADDAICAWGDWESDLVVIANRRRGRWSRFWHGSVSAEVARRSRTPVLLVPAGEGPADLSAEPPLGRVLVPLDGTAGAERALGPAAAVAALMEGECELLHVVRTRPYAVNWSLAYGAPRTRTAAEPTWEAHRYLGGVADRLKTLPMRTCWQVIADDRPLADAIARYAGLCEADVITLASRGGVGWSGLFRGSLAVRLARRAPVPVLICRTP
jgi:nucleotide-binding universal stress UspA family protein